MVTAPAEIIGASLFGSELGLLPTALTVLVGLVMLLAVRSTAPQAGRPR